MFPNFTGNSRRPRHVNLSGQKSDPFAAHGWTPSASGASQTVSAAAAERQQRQQERQKLQASKRIQKVWRGHKERVEIAKERRSQLEALYRQTPPLPAEARLQQALPLLLGSFTLRERTSIGHLETYVRDILSVGVQPLGNAQTHPSRLASLAEILVSALEQTSSTDSRERVAPLITALAYVVEYHPAAVATISTRYYTLLARLCSHPTMLESSCQALSTAITCPLSNNRGCGLASSSAYESFAFSFLTAPDIGIVEETPSQLASLLDTTELAKAIQTVLTQMPGKQQKNTTELLWLLSHFIALGRSASWGTQGSQYLKTLYTILHTLTSENQDILSTVARNDLAADEKSSTPPYVETQIRSLVDTDGISDLLHKITNDYTSSLQSREFDDASLLAGFTLTLLRAFPISGDEIRMRLFLSDASTDSAPLPSIHFFWRAVKTTSIYTDIVTGRRSASDLIRTDKLAPRALAKAQVLQHEWKTILLFLELYVFLLRLTDDDDFFAVMNPNSSTEFNQSSRVRCCNFQLPDVKSLTIFLKNLAFSLYYDAAEILRPKDGTKSASGFLSSYLDTGSSGSSHKDTTSQAAHFSSLTALLGVGFHPFRDTVATALRMLYERDSRRPFLPANHWLMISRFDMEGFVNAVVKEEQRQQQIRADEESEDAEPEDDGAIMPFSIHTIRLSRHARIEALRDQQKRTYQERMMAVIGPKLEILKNMPFVIPFETRVQIFREFVDTDKLRRRHGYVDPDHWRMAMMDNGTSPNHGRHNAKIRRGSLFRDAFRQFYELGDGLKEPIQITFVDQFDHQEPGIDGGGVTKEFLTSVTREAFSTADGNRLFASNSQNLLYPNPHAMDERKELLKVASGGPQSREFREGIADLLKQYEFLGRIVGKCMYEGILIDVAFAGFFLLKWASSGQGAGSGESSYRANVNDLRELDEELYQGLIRLKNYDGDVSDLAQDFTILDQVSLPGDPIRTVTRELVPGGQAIPVTNENRPLYISYVARHRLVRQPFHQTKAFLKGLGAIIEPSWLSMFNQNELQRLVGGDSSMIDVEDLRGNTEYSGVYQIGDDGEEHPTIKLFWRVMHEMTDSERRDVIKYVTSTPRAPLLGFSQLNPRFTIRDSSQEEDRLPSTSTCINLLKLPQYRTKRRLRDKLLYATQSGAGFDLS
ncbi:putative E3 ubiquitin protein ligase [Zalerion maritima]|uniref:HECT-type E3 ubiquitin transferase n=1 Tax=Zalerion maritima TaxID=339359 RepID=A0AAD5RZ43_9PEZI|nr:putative E3 ubiquitin protein ligase [Zalerion maritima]